MVLLVLVKNRVSSSESTRLLPDRMILDTTPSLTPTRFLEPLLLGRLMLNDMGRNRSSDVQRDHWCTMYCEVTEANEMEDHGNEDKGWILIGILACFILVPNLSRFKICFGPLP
ncbi:hypothetical protein MUK42_07423 [Musa troglodytarum]|uniref:Uncharacterized protein n=1 Tax=Musa troglodytarum TaxID=320322 RepID=A0A9E7FQM4_9LILI|nr:hypothetical protein MUK42_37311 [Musa troglodytarum]URD99281.1 hypothetical protein MUK42_07423 [Musa troglodytarum]